VGRTASRHPEWPAAGAEKSSAHPGPRRAGCLGGSGQSLSPSQIRGPAAAAWRGEGGARWGFHPRVRIRTFAFFPLSPPPPAFLKAKAVIYRPFRFAECSLCEPDIQTPPKGEEERKLGVEAVPASLALRCAGPATPPPCRTLDRAARLGRRALVLL
jgi:hypothetical protein